MKKALACLFIFLIFPSAYAIGLAHSENKLIFEPNKEAVVQFQLRGVREGLDFEISLEGELKDYATVSPLDDENYFTVTIKFPAKLEPPGEHFLYVQAKEIPPENVPGIYAVTTARVPIVISVPYDGSYLTTQLKATNVKQGEDVEFKLNVRNLGNADSEPVSAQINIFDSAENLIDSIQTNAGAVPANGEITLQASWPTEGVSQGKYTAKSELNYNGAGSELTSETEFRIGTLSLSIINYSKTLEKGLSPFFIEVESNWNERIQAAYGEIKIENITAKTSPEDIEPFGKSTLKGYINTEELSTGKHEAEFIVYYSNKTETIKGEVQVVPKGASYAAGINFLSIGIIALVLIGLFILFLLVRKRL